MRPAKLAGALLIALGTIGASEARAGCTARDSWRGFDKREHAAAGAAVAAAWSFHTRDPWQGFAAGVLVGALKEATDAAGGGVCSWQDFAATAAGAAIGATGAGLTFRLTRGGAAITYTRTF